MVACKPTRPVTSLSACLPGDIASYREAPRKPQDGLRRSLVSSPSRPSPAATAPQKTHKLRGGVTVIEGSGGNIAVLTGPDGKVFVDAGITATRPRILDSARAKEDCDLALLDERTFRVMIEETPQFVWYVINEFAARLRAAHALL